MQLGYRKSNHVCSSVNMIHRNHVSSNIETKHHWFFLTFHCFATKNRNRNNPPPGCFFSQNACQSFTNLLQCKKQTLVRYRFLVKNFFSPNSTFSLNFYFRQTFPLKFQPLCQVKRRSLVNSRYPGQTREMGPACFNNDPLTTTQVHIGPKQGQF